MSKPDKLLLLVNLGSPKTPEPNDVGNFLNEFLMDPLVIDIPKPLRWLLVKKLIVPKRKFQSAKAYKSIWMEEGGSPLVYYTKNMVQEVANELKNFHVDFAMRYNGPSLSEVIEQYKNFKEIYLLPVYPQYAESSTETVFAEVKRILKAKTSLPKILKADYFFNTSEYIDSLTHQVSSQIKDKNVDHILFSYHGLPENHMRKLGPSYKTSCITSDCCPKRFGSDHLCYRAQCFETTHLVTQNLNIDSTIGISTSFQSRLGRAEWVKPYTTEHIVKLVKEKGVKNLAVICPSFVCDCLETLEEIDMELREQFKELGGNEFHYIPAFNTQEHWIKNLSSWVNSSHSSWQQL